MSLQMSEDNKTTDHVNGTEESKDSKSAVVRSEHFQTLLDDGLSQKVAEKLDELFVAGESDCFCR